MLKEFTLRRDIRGYIRGYETVTVKAESLQEAMIKADQEYADVEILRDDTDKDTWEEG